MMIFSEDSLWTKPPRLKEEEKPLVLITYNESIFSTNNGKKKVYKEKGKSFLQLKGKRKEIMASEFFTLIGKLRVLNFIPYYQLLQDKN